VRDTHDQDFGLDTTDMIDIVDLQDEPDENPIVCYDYCRENPRRNENDIRCIDNKAYRVTTENFLIDEENPECSRCCKCERRILDMDLLEDCSQNNLTCRGGKCIPSYVRIEPGLVLGDEVQQPTGITHPFWVSTTEVTQREFLSLISYDIANTPSENNYYDAIDYWDRHPENPMVNISWLSSIKYTNELSLNEGLQPCYDDDGNVIGGDMGSPYLCEGYRLPTETEWVYICQSGLYAESYCNGDVQCLDQYEWTRRNTSTFEGTPLLQWVAQKLSNNYGIYDIVGNAYEWIYDSAEYNEIGDAIHAEGFDNYLNNDSNYKYFKGKAIEEAPPDNFVYSCYNLYTFEKDFNYKTVSFRVAKTIWRE
jgi:formylglycine-generating enzyme required for sulfatase activity